MSSFFKNLAAAILASAAFHSSVALSEPLMTTFEFSEPAYTDTLTTNSVVVTVTRSDQDPSAAGHGSFVVNCKLIGGTAIENADYRLGVARPASGIWTLTFVPGVKQQSFTVTTIKKPGANKTLQFQLMDPDGSGPAVTGSNVTTTVTIVNPRSAPTKKTS